MMKEISRRVMKSEEEGIACGPVSTYAIDAELVVEDSGNIIYLHTQWVDQADDMMLFEATTESMYDVYEELNKIMNSEEFDREAFDAGIEKRDRLEKEAAIQNVMEDINIHDRYSEQYAQMIQMMQEILDEDGIECDLAEIEF